MSHAIAIILARAGSKGLPGKNSRPIAGRPCVQWSLEHARSAKTVAMTALSTDDPALIALAGRLGVRAVPRPANLATDGATVDDAARHAVMTLDHAQCLHEGTPPTARDPIVILYGNVPVRPPDLIDRAVDLCLSTGCDSVQSYAPVGKNHPWWTARLAPDGAVAPWEGDVLNHGVYRRQDLPPAYIPDGGIIVVRRRALFLALPGVAAGPHAFLGNDRRGVINPPGAVIDVDTEIDAIVADATLSARPPTHDGP